MNKIEAKRTARHPLIAFAQEINKIQRSTDEIISPEEYAAVGELSDYDIVLILRKLYSLKENV